MNIPGRFLFAPDLPHVGQINSVIIYFHSYCQLYIYNIKKHNCKCLNILLIFFG